MEQGGSSRLTPQVIHELMLALMSPVLPTDQEQSPSVQQKADQANPAPLDQPTEPTVTEASESNSSSGNNPSSAESEQQGISVKLTPERYKEITQDWDQTSSF